MRTLRLAILLCVISLRFYCQVSETDSILDALSKAKNDSSRTFILTKVAEKLWRAGNFTRASEYANEAVALGNKISYKTGAADGSYQLGNINAYQGRYPEALQHYLTALKIYEDSKNTIGTANAMNNIGTMFYYQQNFKDAEKYYKLALLQMQNLNNKAGIANGYNNLGNICAAQGDFEKALGNFQKTIELRKEAKDDFGLADSYQNLGNIYADLGDTKKSLENYDASLKLSMQIGYERGVATSYCNIGFAYFDIGNMKEATKYIEMSIDAAKKSGMPEIIRESEKSLSDIYSRTGKPSEAFEHYKNYITVRDSLYNKENTEKTLKLELNYEFEKKSDALKMEQKQKEDMAKEEAMRQRIVIWFVAALLLLVIIFSVFIFSRWRVTQKQKVIIESQKSEVEEKNKEIEEKNKDITDSINYARRIQHGILPSDTDIKNYFEDFFVLYLPKDIVSGDFYWAVKGTSQKTGDTVSIMAAIDCTGHGVPGGFMSMLGNTLLNQTIFDPNVIYPSDVLNYLNRELPKNLKSAEQNTDIKDGMDMALCSFNFDKMKLIYSGANNPCWIIRDKTVIELKADKQPISASPDLQKFPFTDKEFTIQKGDMVYLFTDGYADQFGGPKGKKFKYKQLEERLIEVSQLPTKEQKEILKEVYLKWKGNLEQIDDVLLIGISVN